MANALARPSKIYDVAFNKISLTVMGRFTVVA